MHKFNKDVLDAASIVIDDSKIIGLLYKRDAQGQEEHGGLTRDKFYGTCWTKEAVEEMVDAIWYLTAQIESCPKAKNRVQLQTARLHILDAIETIMGEPK